MGSGHAISGLNYSIALQVPSRGVSVGAEFDAFSCSFSCARAFGCGAHLRFGRPPRSRRRLCGRTFVIPLRFLSVAQECQSMPCV
eukprot:5451923-Pleurochrysis_carterae.AAC.1